MHYSTGLKATFIALRAITTDLNACILIFLYFYKIQSQEFGQIAILPLPHGALMRRQQMISPGLARLGLLQELVDGQDGLFRARDVGLRDPIPVTAEEKERGTPPLSETTQYPNEQQVSSKSKEVLGEASCGRWRALK